MGNKDLVNLGKLQQLVLKMAKYIDFLFQLITNAMGRGVYPYVLSACVRKYLKT